MARPELARNVDVAGATATDLKAPQGEIDRIIEVLSSEASMLSELVGYHAHKISSVVRSEPIQDVTPLNIPVNTPLGTQLKDIADRLYFARVGLGTLTDQVEL